MELNLTAKAITEIIATDKILKIRVNSLEVTPAQAKAILKRNFDDHEKLHVIAHELRAGCLSYMYIDTTEDVVYNKVITPQK